MTDFGDLIELFEDADNFAWFYRFWLFCLLPSYRDKMRRKWFDNTRLYVVLDITMSILFAALEVFAIYWFFVR